MGLQDLTGSANQIVHAYEISGPGCRVSRVQDTISNTPRAYQDGAAGSYGFGQQIQHAFKVSGRCCRTSRVMHIRSNLPTRYQVGVAGSHGLGTTDRTCLLGISR